MRFNGILLTTLLCLSRQAQIRLRASTVVRYNYGPNTFNNVTNTCEATQEMCTATAENYKQRFQEDFGDYTTAHWNWRVCLKNVVSQVHTYRT